MGTFGLEQLSTEGKCLHGKLRVISLVVFVFPFMFMFCILYQQNFFSSLKPLHLLIFLFIAVLAFAGIMMLRQVFNKFILAFVFMKKTETGEIVMMEMPNDTSEFSGISTSFIKLITRLEETGRHLEKLDGELKEANIERHKAQEALIPLK